ncbi:MAG: hypothetical protein ACPG4T_10380, partial [Nannocystaceae bacterium]
HQELEQEPPSTPATTETGGSNSRPEQDPAIALKKLERMIAELHQNKSPVEAGRDVLAMQDEFVRRTLESSTKHQEFITELNLATARDRLSAFKVNKHDIAQELERMKRMNELEIEKMRLEHELARKEAQARVAMPQPPGPSGFETLAHTVAASMAFGMEYLRTKGNQNNER